MYVNRMKSVSKYVIFECLIVQQILSHIEVGARYNEVICKTELVFVLNNNGTISLCLVIWLFLFT